ncbi:MAG: S8 family peptidase, partial [Flavobacteriaceae bacterium]|nr:S8 family peptidase [Flavobacteriaceae bacterium]
SAIQPTQKPDVVAKGSATAVIDENDTIVTNNGTSFSSPIIAGSIACLLQAQPFSTVDEISQAVRMSSSQYEFPDYFLGYGIPDFCNALTLLSVPEIDSQDIRIHPNPVSSTLHLNASEGSPILVSVTDTLGKRVVEDETLYNNQLDVSQLKSGLYFLNIHSSESHKIIKFIKN